MRRHGTMTFELGVETLGRRESKKLANNTYLVRVNDDTLAVRLHDTNVVTVYRDGTFMLDSGGWRTVTTKDRINGYSPASVGSRSGVWYVGGVLYHDGIKISAEGRPITEENKP